MIGVLHATVIEVPHLHKTAYSSYRNDKTGMTSTRTKLPETMHGPAAVGVDISPALHYSLTPHRQN